MILTYLLVFGVELYQMLSENLLYVFSDSSKSSYTNSHNSSSPLSSSTSRAFPSMWGRRNRFGFLVRTLSFPLVVIHLQPILHESVHVVIRGTFISLCLSRFECVSGLSVYWPMIALGTRECGAAKLCRDPTVQSEFFLRVPLLKTFH